jgi:hypothetical protein
MYGGSGVLPEATQGKGRGWDLPFGIWIKKQKTFWVAINKGSGLVVDDLIDINSYTNDDVVVIDVRWCEEKILRIDSINFQRDSQSAERQAQNMNWQIVIWQCW